MAVTTTPRISKLAKQLQQDFPAYHFIEGELCMWSASAQTITYSTASPAAELLHELAHALLGHADFTYDISLMRLEAAAWEYAVIHLAPRYKVHIGPQTIEEHLDTYRQWLHNRSLCPQCQQNGIQDTKNTYRCINCRCSWRVNDARLYALRRVEL